MNEYTPFLILGIWVLFAVVVIAAIVARAVNRIKAHTDKQINRVGTYVENIAELELRQRAIMLLFLREVFPITESMIDETTSMLIGSSVVDDTPEPPEGSEVTDEYKKRLAEAARFLNKGR
jgi:hypothetical protein